MKLRILGNRLLVEEVVAIKSEGGIHFPETAVNHYQHAPGAKLYRVVQLGDKITEPVRVGDRVLCHSYTEGAVPINGGASQIIRENQIIANMTDHTA